MNIFFKGILAVSAICLFGTAEAKEAPVRKAKIDGGTYAATAKNATTTDDTEWKSLGMGRYRDDLITTFYIVDNYEFEVEIQESNSRPGLYRLVSPYKNYPVSPATFEGDTYMIIDASDPERVYFDKYDTGMDWGSGNIIINSIAGDYNVQNPVSGLEQAYVEGLCGTLEDGAITFPNGSLLISDDTIGVGLYLQSNRNGKFRIMLPDAPDLDIVITIADDITEQDGNEYISVDFVLDEDIEKAKIAMVEGDYSKDMVDGITDGSIPSAEITQSGPHLFPFENDGIFTFVAVPYYGGEPKKAEYVTKELSYKHEGWNDIGTALYTEGFIADCEVQVDNMDVVTTSVACQQNTDNPGLFRLVDPYGPGYQYYNEQDYDHSRHYYMEIDVTDPDRVIINQMGDGCGLSFSWGKMIMWSRAGYYLANGMTEEEVEEKNVYGKLAGDDITFPRQALLIKFINVVDTWYWANLNGSFKVVLPATRVGITDITDESTDSPVEYYTLTGVKAMSGDLTPGVYIKKQGAKASKVIIR